MMTGKHTPIPWHTGGTGFSGNVPTKSIWGPTPEGAQSGEWISKDVSPANAEFIILACNSHDELLAALRSFLRAYEAMYAKYPDMITTAVNAVPPTLYGFKKKAEAAIAKAEGK